jgi:LAO/AO transport system kinase
MPQSSSEHVDKIRESLQNRDVDGIWNALIDGDRSALSMAITLAESELPDHRTQALDLIERALGKSGQSTRLGITGVPGVGKSTVIEALGRNLIEGGKKVAVLAVDPSSSRTRGSILGDKTRMPFLANSENAFVRPSPSGTDIGGVTRHTRESILLCEAAGFDTIIVETVGVGQSETAVHGMVDFFLLLMLSGGGDELQGIKRGIMELAHGIAINKADGDNLKKAKLAQAEYVSALHLLPPLDSGWTVPVKLCSSLENEGVVEIWESVSDYIMSLKSKDLFENTRVEQSIQWLRQSFQHQTASIVLKKASIASMILELENEVRSQSVSPSRALDQFLQLIESQVFK